MAKTKTFTVDNVAPADPVQVATVCKRVIVYENNQAGTTDYDVYAPATTDTPVRRPAGAKTEFNAPGGSFFQPGETIAHMNAVTAGSYTFAQEEQ